MDFYQQIDQDYKLTMEQNLQYLHNVLSEDALRVYLDALKPYETTFNKSLE